MKIRQICSKNEKGTISTADGFLPFQSRVVEGLGLCRLGSSSGERLAEPRLRPENNIARILLHLQFTITARNKFLMTSFCLILFHFNFHLFI